MQLSPKAKSELVISWFFALPAVLALFEIHTKFVAQNMHTGGGEQNAALFPRLLSCLLLFFIILKNISIFLEVRKGRGNPEERVHIVEPAGRKRLALIFGIFTAYLIGLVFLGYYAATPLALAALFLALGIRKVLPLTALSLGITLAVWYAFAVLLKVVLPVGRLGLYF